MHAAFSAPWWLRSGHLQTLWPPLVRRAPRPALRRERIELPDGDFVDVDHAGAGDGPRVVVLPGLEGGSESTYVRGLIEAIVRRRWRASVLHFRGCGGAPNRLARSYHSGETGDLDFVLGRLRARDPGVEIALVGYSLGGNVLLRWLAGRGAAAPAAAAVAVCVPLVLEAVADRLDGGISRLYQWWLLASLGRSLRRRARLRPVPVRPMGRADWWSFRGFDDKVTAPLHGFAGAADYYRRASARPVLARIAVPTLIVQALDDPFMTAAVHPHASELSATTTLELCAGGGHVGFVTGSTPWGARYWLEERIPAFLAPRLAPASGRDGGWIPRARTP